MLPRQKSSASSPAPFQGHCMATASLHTVLILRGVTRLSAPPSTLWQQLWGHYTEQAHLPVLEAAHQFYCTVWVRPKSSALFTAMWRQRSSHLGFGLDGRLDKPFRSPLLRKSRLLSFPPVTKMFQFTGLPLPFYEFIKEFIGVAPFGNLRIKIRFQFPEAYRRLMRPSSSLSA